MTAARAKTPAELPPLLTMKEIRERYPLAILIDCEDMNEPAEPESTARVAGYGKTLREAAEMANAAGLIDEDEYRLYSTFELQQAKWQANLAVWESLK